MKETYQELLINLNTEWKNYIEEQRLAILSKTTDAVVDVLFNLEFSTPREVKEKLEVEDGSHSFDITLSGSEITTTYTGEQDLAASNEFTLGIYETYSDGGYPMTGWRVDSEWYNAMEVTGLSFTDYFWVFDIDDYVEEIDNIFTNFKLQGKIDQLAKVHNKEVTEKRGKEIIEKYNQSTVSIVEEHEQLFILFFDGRKVPFNLE